MVSCQAPDEKRLRSFDIKEFNALTNYITAPVDTLSLKMDLSDAIDQGITIPSDSARERYFKVAFKIKNNDTVPARYYYKVLYQNESYMFEENNPRSEHNFYGSWHEGETGFRVIQAIPADNEFHTIVDSIKIIGNPRNEEKYLKESFSHAPVSDRKMNEMLHNIRRDSKWMKAILKKAKARSVPPSVQLMDEAEWMVRNNWENTLENTRWRRNPRVGNYRFAVAVTSEKEFDQIPMHIRDITLKKPGTDQFENPFAYFQSKVAEDSRNCWFSTAPQVLNTRISFEPSRGIFVNPMDLPRNIDLRSRSTMCNTEMEQYQRAHFQQFIHHSDYKHYFDNIPKVADVVEDKYNRIAYQRDSVKFDQGWKRSDASSDTDAPCTTVGYDSARDAIYVKNPGSTLDKPFRKENVGVKTRIGFTYGKYTAKIQFPKIVNQDYVWNGLTCAFWLYYQSSSEWNMRNTVCEGGYLPKGSPDKYDRHQRAPYSEIDIEIVKTSKYWPQTSYGDFRKTPVDDALNENVIITCTNWDLACPDPSNYKAGAHPVDYQDQTFELHRWDAWYKALTLKTEYPQSQTMGDVFYFQIDWQPDRIIWRLGPDKENMTVIGYMDDKYTTIPDNQMIAVVTQEFHHGTWWPLARFQQGLIPYPKNDLTGYIHSIEIE